MIQVSITYKGKKYVTEYFATEQGEILRNGKKFKKAISLSGYYHVTIHYQCGKQVTKQVHRIIAECFIPNPLNKREVNHINGNKLDNRVCNLEWVTPKENTHHAIRMGLSKPRDMSAVRDGYKIHKERIIEAQRRRVTGIGNPMSKLSECEVMKIRTFYKEGKRPFEIAKIFGLARQTIEEIIMGTRWGHLPFPYKKPKSLKCKRVNKIKDGKVIATYETIKDAEKTVTNGKGHSAISACCKGKRKQYGGYQWQYEE